jgi:hypothetical protein
MLRNNDAVFKDDNSPIDTAGTLQSWFEKHENELSTSSLATTFTRFEHY